MRKRKSEYAATQKDTEDDIKSIDEFILKKLNNKSQMQLKKSYKRGRFRGARKGVQGAQGRATPAEDVGEAESYNKGGMADYIKDLL